jgi:hypothetical protein
MNVDSIKGIHALSRKKILKITRGGDTLKDFIKLLEK